MSCQPLNCQECIHSFNVGSERLQVYNFLNSDHPEDSGCRLSLLFLFVTSSRRFVHGLVQAESKPTWKQDA